MSAPRLSGRSAAVGVGVLFLLAGGISGSWAGRIPSVRSAVGAGDATWGFVLLAQSVGALAVLLVVARFPERLRARTIAPAGAVLLLVIAPITASQQTVAGVAICLLVQGIATGLLFGPMNALAVRVQQSAGRSILALFHACFSLGQLSGALLGAAAGARDVAPGIQIACTSLVFAALLFATVRRLPRSGEAPAAEVVPAATGNRFAPGVAPLAAMALLTSLNEGAALQWSAQYSVELGAPVALGSLTLASFSVAIVAVRLVGDRLIDRLGPQRFVRLSATASVLGIGGALLIGTVPAALAGFALLGIGSGCMMPVIFAASGMLPGVDPTRGVALVSLGEWPSFLIGPVLIGGAAQVVGLRGALGCIVVSAILLAVLSVRLPGGAPRAVAA